MAYVSPSTVGGSCSPTTLALTICSWPSPCKLHKFFHYTRNNVQRLNSCSLVLQFQFLQSDMRLNAASLGGSKQMRSRINLDRSGHRRQRYSSARFKPRIKSLGVIALDGHLHSDHRRVSTVAKFRMLLAHAMGHSQFHGNIIGPAPHAFYCRCPRLYLDCL